MAAGAPSHLRRRAGQLARLFFTDTSAATSIEYALIAVIVSISIIGGMQLIGTELSAIFFRVSTELAGASMP